MFEACARYKTALVYPSFAPYQAHDLLEFYQNCGIIGCILRHTFADMAGAPGAGYISKGLRNRMRKVKIIPVEPTDRFLTTGKTTNGRLFSQDFYTFAQASAAPLKEGYVWIIRADKKLGPIYHYYR